ncbi:MULTISPECIES: hypothetical protein [unclassified Bradyrhizobium]|uniref:hypothetical protein n=1 Tax=unclassified Bradyrhizobium TaxID=2631580 RepID=UPI0004064C00|nr:MULTISPECIES: hypothetical protein [unclassified Bradyrhizobium]QIG92091.1 hypothetical protein G6P99_05960 [Bradyrhizobium sp. 6(2017)]
MDWFYYLLVLAVVLPLVAFGLHGSLYRRDTRKDEKLNRLIDERIERLDLERPKKED